MRQNAYCPHPEHQATRVPVSPDDLEARKTGQKLPAHVRLECPDCGIPVSCSEEHFADDYESHLEICDLLRQVNEDDHDLHSGRFFPEFEYPGSQIEEAQVNMTNWDTFLYSREFNAVNEERPMRQVTRLLTYPATVGSVLHELSPYNLKNRLLPEGLRSLSGMLKSTSITCKRMLMSLQLSDTLCIHLDLAPAPASKVSVLTHHQCVCSSLVHARSLLFPVKSGSNSLTSFHGPHFT